jgi:hypothetical protein
MHRRMRSRPRRPAASRHRRRIRLFDEVRINSESRSERVGFFFDLTFSHVLDTIILAINSPRNAYIVGQGGPTKTTELGPMSSGMLRECRFLIPLCRDKDISDGEHHETDTWQWLDDELTSRFDGRTKSSGLFQGAWKNPKTGALTRDESIQFLVAVPEARLDEIRELLGRACGVFAQQCIYLTIAGNVEFVEPKV